MIVDCAYYVRGVQQFRKPVPVEDVAAVRRHGSSYVWIELHEPEPELMTEVSEHFGLHELAVEDAQRAHQRPKVEGYDDFYFIVFRTVVWDEREHEVKYGELDLFLESGAVIAVRHGDAADSEAAHSRLEDEHPELLKSGPAAVVWGILDSLVDDYQPVVEGLESDIEDVERAIFAGNEDLTERIYLLKRRINEVYRAVHPLLTPLEALEHGAFAQMDPKLLRYFRDVNDHVRRLQEEVVAQREQLNSALEANLALLNVRQNQMSAAQNQVVKQLTVVATVFLPLTFVTGFFGQNFAWMVERLGSLGMFLTAGVGGLVLPCAALFVWFKRGGYI
jgi:magnesium transporter